MRSSFEFTMSETRSYNHSMNVWPIGTSGLSSSIFRTKSRKEVVVLDLLIWTMIKDVCEIVLTNDSALRQLRLRCSYVTPNSFTSNIIIVNECSKFPSSFTRLCTPRIRRIRSDILWTYLRKLDWEITTANEFRSSILLYLVTECSMIRVHRMERRSEEWKIDRGNGTSV